MTFCADAADIERYRAAREFVELTSSWRVQRRDAEWALVLYEHGRPMFWVALGLARTIEQAQVAGNDVRRVLHYHMENVYNTLWSLAAGNNL